MSSRNADYFRTIAFDLVGRAFAMTVFKHLGVISEGSHATYDVVWRVIFRAAWLPSADHRDRVRTGGRAATTASVGVVAVGRAAIAVGARAASLRGHRARASYCVRPSARVPRQAREQASFAATAAVEEQRAREQVGANCMEPPYSCPQANRARPRLGATKPSGHEMR